MVKTRSGKRTKRAPVRRPRRRTYGAVARRSPTFIRATRSRYSAVGGGTRTRSYGARSPYLPTFALAQVKPFHEKAKGVRVPDTNTAPSVAFRLDDTWTLSSTDANANSMSFMPWIRQLVATHSGVGAAGTATSWTVATAYGGSDSGKASGVNSTFRLIRPVAFGLKISSLVPPQYAQGFVHVCLCPMDVTGSTWPAATSIAQMQSMPGYKRVPIASLVNNPIYVSAKYIDDSAFLYRYVADVISQRTSAAAGAGVGGDSYGWMLIQVAIENAYSTNVAANQVSIETCLHMEGQLSAGGSGAVGLESTPSPVDPQIMATASRAVSDMDPVEHGRPQMGPAGQRDAEAEFWTAAASVADELVRSGVRSLGGSLVRGMLGGRRTLARIGN